MIPSRGMSGFGGFGVKNILPLANPPFFAILPEILFKSEVTMEWRASHILVKDEALAKEVLKKLKTGGNFESLAREFSTCPSKSSGGDLGWFGPGKMVSGFEEAVKRLGNGSVSDLVRTQFGYHIIKKTGQK
jgi:peptidyl-prolyl cis-trans isomerase C